MQLKSIQDLFKQFKNYLRDPEAQSSVFIWESQQIFQNNWNLDSSNIRAMYDASIDSPVSRRLWSRENHAPKLMMLEFAAMEPEMVRLMFRDLFAEEKDIEGRLGRFVFYCDELLQAYKEQFARPVYNSHFHNDNYFMASLYLAFRYPDRYVPYYHEAFVALLRRLQSPDIPVVNDPARFFKVARTLYQIMHKDEEIIALNAQRLATAKPYSGDSLLLVYDFYLWAFTNQVSPVKSIQ